LAAQTEDNKIRCRMIVIRQDGALERRVAIEQDREQLRLPALEISRRYRLAAGLTLAMKRRWGITGVYTPIPVFPNGAGQTDCQYRVMECLEEQEPAESPLGWKPCSTLAAASFSEPQDYQAVRFVLGQVCQRRGSDSPFANLGWFHEVRAWVREVISPLGLKLRGDFEQWNGAPAFSLIRFSTDRGSVWFKAAGAPNSHELALTRELSTLSPEHNVRLLAEKPEWNAWLALEAEGVPLEEIADVNGWLLAANSLAKLQIASIERAPRLIEEGAADLRVHALPAMAMRFFQAARAWMLEQGKTAAQRLSSDEILALEQQIREFLNETARLGIPETLGHMDPNPGNVIVSPKGRCVFLDWAEGYVGYPFLSFEYLLLHFRRSPLAAAVGDRALEETYWNAWKPLVPSATLGEAQRLTPLLAVLTFAVHLFTQSQTNRMLDPETVGLLRSLIRRMKREASLLRAGIHHSALAI